MQPTYLSAVARASEDKMAAKMAHTGPKMADTLDSYSLDRTVGVTSHVGQTFGGS